MILTLDIGNSQIYGGLFDKGQLKMQFRKSSKHGNSSDEIGLFLRQVLAENKVNPSDVEQIALCSVVPDLIHSVGSACMKYFSISPFILRAGVRTGLKIKYRNPLEVGADRIANAIGATHMFPKKNLIIIDFGTATTFCAINEERDYLGGVIIPGLRLSMESLETQTAQLPKVEIRAIENTIGRSTVESIQSGLYWGTLTQVQGIIKRIREEGFYGKNAMVIGTGGFSRLFEKEKIFDNHIPELVHLGLKEALVLNKKTLGSPAGREEEIADVSTNLA